MADTVSSKPLFAAFKDRGDLAAFAKKIDSSIQRVSNWEERGIPKGAVREVAAALGMTVEQYYVLAGEEKSNGSSEASIRPLNMPRSDKEKLLALIRAFLDTDAEGREELYAAIDAVVGVDESSRHRSSSTGKPKRR